MGDRRDNSHQITLRVCRYYRDICDMKLVYITETSTLLELKKEISREFALNLHTTEFSLTRFSTYCQAWISIDNYDSDKTIAQLNIIDWSTLNIEEIKKRHTSQFDNAEVKNRELTLQLCKQPMYKYDCYYLDVNSSISIAQLREIARERVINSKSRDLYWWTENEWRQLENAVDDLTLSGIGIDHYAILSFGKDQESIPGVCGLTNLGNTCFMNSAFQCLSNIPMFTKEVLSYDTEMSAPIIGAFSALMKTMWSGKHSVTRPSSLFLNIRDNLPRFSRYRQHDAQEFMNYFLHAIHQELTSERTLITDFFYGHMQSCVSCLNGCGSVDTTTETFTFLPVPVDDAINQYNILYLQKNGEQNLLTVSIDIDTKTVEHLIELFIAKHDFRISSRQIGAYRVKYHQIFEEYSSFMSLRDVVKDQITFIELPEKEVVQNYIKCKFLDHKTSKPFRPPVFMVIPTYDCHTSHLSAQLIQLRDHFCSVTGAPITACHFYLVNESHEYCKLVISGHVDNQTLVFMKEILFEVEPEWIVKYTNKYSFDRSLKTMSLESLLIAFFQEDSLLGKYHCSKCPDLTTAKQKSSLVPPLPPVLIIQLKRFTYDIYSNDKIDSYIEFPLEKLDLSPYVVHNENRKRNISSLYDLVAVSNHRGSLTSGHYTTYAKNCQNQKWYLFNDEVIDEVANPKDIVRKDAYILVYVRR